MTDSDLEDCASRDVFVPAQHDASPPQTPKVREDKASVSSTFVPLNEEWEEIHAQDKDLISNDPWADQMEKIKNVRPENDERGRNF